MSTEPKSDYQKKRGKRDKMIGVWCSQEEFEWIEKQAGKVKGRGISKGNYCLQIVLGRLRQAEEPFSEADQPIKLEGAITKQRLEKLLNQQLPKIANNINQLTRHVNSQQSIGREQTEELARYRKDLDELTLAIIKAIS